MTVNIFDTQTPLLFSFQFFVVVFFCLFSLDIVALPVVTLTRCVTVDDLVWFDKTVRRAVGEELSEEYQEMVTPNPFFCDFMRYFFIRAFRLCDKEK